MKKTIATLALIPLLAAGGGQSVVNTGNHRKIFAAGCSAPSASSRWTAWNPSNLCGTTPGTTCTNGAQMFSVPDLGTQGVSIVTGGTAPTYTTSALNGLAAMTWTGTEQLNASGPIAGSGSLNFTLWAVLKPNASGVYLPIVGSINGGGIGWRLTPTTLTPELDIAFVTIIGTASTPVSTSGYSLIEVTYSSSTGAYNFYSCSAGSCTSAGSGTNAQTFSDNTDRVGTTRPNSGSNFFKGNIVEIGYRNSIDTTNIASYVQCQYGI